jgi:hypothetical protein
MPDNLGQDAHGRAYVVEFEGRIYRIGFAFCGKHFVVARYGAYPTPYLKSIRAE